MIAIDWGTSSLRCALLDEQGQVIEERHSPNGILNVPPGGFAHVLIAATQGWTRATATFCLISGMAGSRQGWHEAPYCPCPAGFPEVAAHVAWIDPSPPGLRVAIVPGLSDERVGVPDVLRGEETQIFGALALLGLQEGVFVLPGTHSKWVEVREGRIESFATFMTGEFYGLLRHHSILSRTLPAENGALDESAFVQGIVHSRQTSSLLHSAFSVRTMSLFDRMPAPALPSYLSGLAIGEELRARKLDAAMPPVIVIGSEELTARYQLGLQAFGIASQRIGDEATWCGLWAIAQILKDPA